ncbi:glycoside hydrolase family 97 protein [Natronococcus wangiae]|uniref:glycoside hydrolase family 97 protein n=1 Tax=Natronococcus wangiae TaxID=3068275 RepID=UPI00273E8D96|nr:glycoside hydrolase family 97 protein [Natronococcus sp. AD5]
MSGTNSPAGEGTADRAEEAGETDRLPVTRRSVLRGAAAVGPVAGLASTDEIAESARATSGDGESVTVSSPNGELEATVALGPSGELDDDLPPGRVATLTVCYGGTTVLEPSPLGITTYAGQFVSSLSLEGQRSETVTRDYETVGGDESGTQTLRARVSTLTFGSPNGVLKLELVASDEGVAYRYRLPGEGHVLVDKEVSAFQIPDGSTAWLHEYDDHYESLWEETDAESAAGNFGFPCLFEVADDAYALVTEANVDGNYCASHVAVDAPTEGDFEPRPGKEDDRDEIVPGNEEFDYDENSTLFELRFAGTYGLPQVVDATLPLATPWRVAIVGDLPTVVESDLVAALSDPPEVEDTSWIEPGIVNWSWWSDGDSPRELETQKEYVDYAAEQGWEYTLVDRGWRREWMPELVEYANGRGVDIIAWMVWYDLDTETKRETLLSRLASWGVSGIKIDYMNADRQDRMQWYDDLLESAAEHELLVNFHGSTVPKGRRRTWPHLLTTEAVRGAESYGWEEMPPSHNLALPYTRNVVGPMDYTPATLSSRYEGAPRAAETSLGHELALSVVYQSNLQHFADSVESYRSYPLAEEFLGEVSAAWDETTFVGGYPAEEATVARRDGDRWFVGSIIAGDGRTVTVPLSFLSDDRRYDARIIRDAEGGSSLEAQERVVTADATIPVRVSENGGFVVRLSRRE